MTSPLARDDDDSAYFLNGWIGGVNSLWTSTDLVSWSYVEDAAFSGIPESYRNDHYLTWRFRLFLRNMSGNLYVSQLKSTGFDDTILDFSTSFPGGGVPQTLSAGGVISVNNVVSKAAFYVPVESSSKLQVGGSDVDPAGIHDWEFWFNEDTKKVKIFFDGSEVVAQSGFDDYFDVSAGRVLESEYLTGDSNLDSTTLDVFIDNIKVNWMESNNDFKAWFVKMPADRARAIVGIDDVDVYIVRVKTKLYPIVTSFKKSDIIQRTDTLRRYKIIHNSDVSDKINMVKFLVKEFK